MRRLQLILLLSLFLLPIIAYIAVGVWALWQTGYLFWTWWIMPVAWTLAYWLSKRWKRGVLPMPKLGVDSGAHWTPRDERAAEIVAEYQQSAQDTPPEKLTDPHFYLQSALELSTKIARHYHPKADDPLSSLTVPEILAAAHLALEDLELWVQNYVPGSHLLSVNQWRRLSNAPSWFRTASNVTWAASVLINPANIGRFVTSKFAVDPLAQQIQTNILFAFFTMFLRQVGFYAIEMNSGRLLGGAAKYRQVVQPMNAQSTGDGKEAPARPVEVQIAVVGQVKAGKSSLVNALLGERLAATDITPLTREVTRYELKLPESGTTLILLDTAGYAEDGLTAKQKEATRDACRDADLILLTMNVTHPAREPDREMIRDLTDWLASDPRRKPPPILGVLTHIDGLTPIMEWQPPYNWDTPTTLKEENIREAVECVQAEFAEKLTGVVPVCTDIDRDHVYGIHEWVLPAMTALLAEAHGCAIVRALHSDLDSRKIKNVWSQLKNAGGQLLSMTLEQLAQRHGLEIGRPVKR